jgi:hypothetical protein
MSDNFKPVKQKIVKDWRRDPHSIEKFQFLYYFIPHPHHKKRAELLSSKALIIYMLMVLALVLVFRFLPVIFPGVLGYASNIKVTDLLKYTNDRRNSAGLSTLVINEKLSVAAKKKAENMFQEDYWAHVSPSGLEPWDFILAQNYDYIYAGENLAKNFSSSKEVVEAWYQSPTHRDNLMNKNYDEIGFGVVNGVLDGYETTLVVQMFGRPRDRNQVTTKSEEKEIIRQITEEAVSDAVVFEQHAPEQGGMPAYELIRQQEVLPIIDVSVASRSISILFVMFLIVMLAIDIWYTKTKGVVKFTGHTFLHLTFLVIVLVSIWFVLTPGSVL